MLHRSLFVVINQRWHRAHSHLISLPVKCDLPDNKVRIWWPEVAISFAKRPIQVYYSHSMHVFASIGLGKGDNISENCYYICIHGAASNVN